MLAVKFTEKKDDITARIIDNECRDLVDKQIIVSFQI